LPRPSSPQTSKTQWSKWVDFEALKTQVENAAHSSVVVPATYEAWYPQWLDFVNVSLQNCHLITGLLSRYLAGDAARAEQLAKS
jgi:hypothetical protein